jgi:phasin family protein
MNKLTVASYEDVVAPVVELNKIFLGYTEKLVELNLATMRKQADAALAGWQAALAVKDAAAAKDYLAAQSEAARTLVEGYAADAKAVSEINQEVANDVRKVMTKGIEKASRKAA